MKTLGLLLDLEGVLYQYDALIEGAAQTLSCLQLSGIKVRYLTNTTTRSQRHITKRLSDYGLDVFGNDVFSPAIAARRYLESETLKSVFLAAEDDLSEDFNGFILNDEMPDAVVMGDLHTRFDWSMLDRIFTMVQSGARLIALHKNRYCRRNGHISLDLGPFVAAIEYASGVQAVVLGKPNRDFFQLALSDMGLMPSDVIMVGDDPFSDIGGARQTGIRAVQVKTGKYKTLGSGDVPEPDAVIDSIADLPTLLGI